MGGAAIAFLSGLGAGYLSQTEKNKDRERQTKLDQVTFDRADRETETYNREKKDRDALREAGTPVKVNSNAAMLGTSGQPTLYEDAGVAGSDYRQARNMAEQTGAEFTDQAPTPAVSVAGKQYDTLASAQGAATAANTPEARTQRVMAAVSGIDPIKALDLENQQVTRGRETTKFTQEQSDRQWRQDLGTAMQSGHEGLAAMVSKSQGGPMAGVNLKPVPSADGKTVTYAKVNADGTTTPTNLTFSNDQSGITQAAYMLDKAITPEHRMDNEMKRVSEARLSKSADSLGTYHEALAGAAGVRAEAMTTKAENGSGKSAYERMPEDLRLQYQGHLKAAKDARDEVRKLEIANNGELSGAALALTDRIKKEAAGSDMKASALLRQYRTEDPPTDQLGFRKPTTTGAVGNATPAVQAARDVEAGDIMMREYGGDVAKAQASANELAGEVKRAKGETKAMLQSHLDRLNSGIRNASQSGAPPAVQPARATVMAANSPVQVASKAPVAAIIPEPPPQFRQMGLQSMPNPLFAQWQQQYGQAYAEQQQAAQVASSQAATTAKATFNPYSQNRVK